MDYMHFKRSRIRIQVVGDKHCKKTNKKESYKVHAIYNVQTPEVGCCKLSAICNVKTEIARYGNM